MLYKIIVTFHLSKWERQIENKISNQILFIVTNLEDFDGNVTGCSVYALQWIMFMTLFSIDWLCITLKRKFHMPVWLFVFVPLERFSLKWTRHHCRWRQRLTGFKCHLDQRRRDTNNCCRTFNTGTATACFDSFGLSRPEFEHPTFRMWGVHVCFNKCDMSYKGNGDRLLH